jgi:hypothetical protein
MKMREASSIDLDALRLRYFEQLPTIAAMLVPDRIKYNAHDVAAEAIALVEAILEVLPESYDESEDDEG